MCCGAAAISFIGDLIGDVIGGITGSKKAAQGQQAAAQIQSNSADKAIAEQRAAREAYQQLSQPYTDAGAKSIAAQMALIGLNGTGAQSDAINALLNSPEYTTGVRQGEESILQNAAATGGLRGGNTQNSLANFRADLLASAIGNQFNRYGAVTSIGQNAAAGTGNAGMQSANAISDLLTQQGAALAGGRIAQGNANQNAFNNAIKIASVVAGF